MEWIIDSRWFSPFQLFLGRYWNSPNDWRFIPVFVGVGAAAALCAPLLASDVTWCRTFSPTTTPTTSTICPSFLSPHAMTAGLDDCGYRFHQSPIYQFLDENLQLFIKNPSLTKIGWKMCTYTKSLIDVTFRIWPREGFVFLFQTNCKRTL